MLSGWVSPNCGKGIYLEIKQNVISLLNNHKFDWKCVLFLNTLYPNLIVIKLVVIKEIIGATEGIRLPGSAALNGPSLEVTKNGLY